MYAIMDINATFLAQSPGIFYMHQVPIEVDSCTKYEQNLPILFVDITTNIYLRKILA